MYRQFETNGLGKFAYFCWSKKIPIIMRRNRTPFRRFLPMDTDVASMIQIVAIIIALVIVMVSIVFLVTG